MRLALGQLTVKANEFGLPGVVTIIILCTNDNSRIYVMGLIINKLTHVMENHDHFGTDFIK